MWEQSTILLFIMEIKIEMNSFRYLFRTQNQDDHCYNTQSTADNRLL